MAHILLVEDDPAVRETLSLMLRSVGHRVTDGYGRDILPLLSADPADLVILDIVMPQPDGVEILKALQPLMPDLRVLAISGGGRISKTVYLQLATGMGATDTLDKPFGREALLAKVDRLLGNPSP